MRTLYLAILLTTCVFTGAFAQSTEYTQKKAEKLLKPSPFEQIMADDIKRELVYEDEHVVAFEPLRKQASVHLLIVPKKRIATINDIEEEDRVIMANIFYAAKKIAQQLGVSETGYRLSVNTNEDAGQSVFHIHVHFLAGMKLGPMMDQTYKEN